MSDDLVVIKCEPESYEIQAAPDLPRTRRGTRRIPIPSTKSRIPTIEFASQEVKKVMIEKRVDEKKAKAILRSREVARARKALLKEMKTKVLDDDFEKREEKRLKLNEAKRLRRAILRGETTEDFKMNEQERKKIELSYQKMSADDILYEKIKESQRKRMRRRTQQELVKSKKVYGNAKSGPESSESDDYVKSYLKETSKGDSVTVKTSNPRKGHSSTTIVVANEKQHKKSDSDDDDPLA